MEEKSIEKLNSGVVHTVYFWLKNPESAADRTALIAGLQTLMAVDEIKQAWIGTPAPTKDRAVIDSSYHVSLTFVFDNAADQDAYQIHPVHEHFVATCKHLWERVQVYDVTAQ
jgi:hypothetical protein